MHARRRQRDVVDDNPTGDELEDAVVDRERLDRDDAVAGEVHGHVGEAEIEEQVAGDCPDAHLTVDVLAGFANDRAADPVAKPRRLRHDEREREQAHQQRPNPGGDVDGAADQDHRLKTPDRC